LNWQFLLLCSASISVEQSPAVGLSAGWSGRGANAQIASPFNAGGNSSNVVWAHPPHPSERRISPWAGFPCRKT
jgi:hypothetical protein